MNNSESMHGSLSHIQSSDCGCPSNTPRLTPAEFSTQAETFKALAHPARLAIVHALADGPVCACDLAEVAASSPSTTSRHLSVLRHAGVISCARDGKKIFYHLERPCVLTFMDCCK